MIPSTSPRASDRSTLFTRVDCARPLPATIVTPVIVRRRSPLARTVRLSMTRLARTIEDPINDEVDGDGQDCDCHGRNEGGDIAVADQGRTLSNHQAPV